MKKFVKLITLMCAAALLLTCFAACNNTDTDVDTSSTGDTTATLRVGTNTEFPPFEYLEGNEPVGIDMDIIKEVGKILNMEVEIQDMDFDSLPNALAADQIDCIIAGFTRDPDREATMDFTDTYYEAYQTIIVPVGSDIKSKDDLNGKRIGVQEGTTGNDAADEIPDATVKPFKSPILATTDMLNGNLDAVIVDDNPAKAISDQNNGQVTLIEGEFEKEDYGIAVKKGNAELLEKLNSAIRQLNEEGKIEEIAKNYVD